MKTKKIILWIGLLVTMTPQSYASEASGAGNGGDVVFCSQSPKNSFSGYYVLDYVLSSSESDVFETSSAAMDKILSSFAGDRFIETGLQSELKLLYSSFLKPEPQNQYYWKAGKGEIHQINDENLKENLPANCGEQSSGKIKLYQTVVRVKQGSQVKFIFDQALIEKISSNKDQLSWLITHEFLWNYLDDAESIRQANELLHSKRFLMPHEIRPPESQIVRVKLSTLLIRMMLDQVVWIESGQYIASESPNCPYLITVEKNNNITDQNQSVFSLNFFVESSRECRRIDSTVDFTFNVLNRETVSDSASVFKALSPKKFQKLTRTIFSKID